MASPLAGPDDRGYPDREGWYEDTGVHSGWAEGDDSGFLPGMGSGPPDDRPTAARVSAARTAGGRRGSTGPGKQGAGRSGSGGSGHGQVRHGQVGHVRAAASARAAFAGGRHGWP